MQRSPEYPLLHPFGQVPSIWLHCSFPWQPPQISEQFCPYLPPSHSVNLNTKFKRIKLTHAIHAYIYTGNNIFQYWLKWGKSFINLFENIRYLNLQHNNVYVQYYLKDMVLVKKKMKLSSKPYLYHMSVLSSLLDSQPRNDRSRDYTCLYNCCCTVLDSSCRIQ